MRLVGIQAAAAAAGCVLIVSYTTIFELGGWYRQGHAPGMAYAKFTVPLNCKRYKVPFVVRLILGKHELTELKIISKAPILFVVLVLVGMERFPVE